MGADSAGVRSGTSQKEEKYDALASSRYQHRSVNPNLKHWEEMWANLEALPRYANDTNTSISFRMVAG